MKTRQSVNSNLTLLMVLMLTGCASSDYRPQLEPFPRDADYDFQLSNLENAQPISVQLTETGFEWPSIDDSVDTIMLEVTIRKARGEYPSVQASFDGISSVQYFEESGQGRRYVDLSKLIDSSIEAGEFVVMEGTGVSWIAEETALVAFENPDMENRRVLVVAPHPDDAEIAAFGLYQSTDAHVVTVTAGDAGGKNYDVLWPEPGLHYKEKGRIRTLDSITVPLLGGLQTHQIRNLGYYDATLRQLWANKPERVDPPLADLEEPAYFRSFNFDAELRNRRFESTWANLVADLLKELEQVNPQTIVIPHPMLDRHADHQYAALAMIEALSQWSGNSEILLYTNHAVGNEAFPLGPRDGMMGLPAWNGGSLSLKGLYSHQLSVNDQKRKLIALEAMHDLRPFDPRNGSEVNTISEFYDYFRRAPRPNEIFLVTDRAGAQSIYENFFKAD